MTMPAASNCSWQYNLLLFNNNNNNTIWGPHQACMQHTLAVVKARQPLSRTRSDAVLLHALNQLSLCQVVWRRRLALMV